MENACYRKHTVREEEREAALERPNWWPLYTMLAVLGALLFWEAWHPLPLISAQVVGLAVLGLLFGGIALWLLHYVSE